MASRSKKLRVPLAVQSRGEKGADRIKDIRSIISPYLSCLILAGVALISYGVLAEDTKPHNAVGSGEDDWWVTYPDQHSRAGYEVEHPSWVLESLEKKPVLILGHTKECRPCKDQIKFIDAVLPSFDEKVTYYDMLLGEGDPRSNAIYGAYNPTGGEEFAPITILVTLVRSPDGDVKVGWHSVDDSTTEEWVRSYIDDAVYYYGQNSEGWKK